MNKRIIISEEELGQMTADDENTSVSTQTGIEDLDSKHLMFSEFTSIIHISMEAHSLGRILKTNSGVYDMTGWSRKNLEGRSINI